MPDTLDEEVLQADSAANTQSGCRTTQLIYDSRHAKACTMSQTILERAKELITKLIRVHHLSPDDANVIFLSRYTTLQSLHRAEAAGQCSISKYAVTCLECGNTFKLFSSRQATGRRRQLTKQIRGLVIPARAAVGAVPRRDAVVRPLDAEIPGRRQAAPVPQLD